MTFHSKLFQCRLTLSALMLALASCAHAATVSFQDRNYSVSIVPLGTNVPAASGCDLIFVILPSNQKYLAIPTDSTVRAVFDPNNQRFYRVDRPAGLINAFTALNSTLINLDGTFYASKLDTPQVVGNGQSTLESYAIPLQIDTTLNADISVLDGSTLAYRTNSPAGTAAYNVYEITRDPSSIVLKTTSIPLKVPGSVAIDFDAENGTHLLVEPAVTDAQNTVLPDRISSYFRDGTKFSEIDLDNNPAIPGYTGNASGIAYDVDTSDIYLLDGNQLIVFKVLRPALTSVTPNHGPVTGAITVQVFGANIPADAVVFFDGVQASNIVIKSDSQISCNPPAHALGTVDVTMTGTGIIPGQPVRLAGGFTYANNPPVAVLSASPTSGMTPLTVSFDVGASFDSDGTLAKRFIDFGDGTSFTFPSDLTIVSTDHTYVGNGTFTAILTVTDNLGATATASQVIIVGTGGDNQVDVLVLRTLTMKVEIPQKTQTDQITMTGEIVLPFGVTPETLAGGTFSLSMNNVPVGSSPLTLDAKGQYSSPKKGLEKLTLKLKKSPATADGTYAFAYTLKKADLHATIPYTSLDTIPSRFTIPTAITLISPMGRSFYFGNGQTDVQNMGEPKQTVVNFKKSARSSAITLVRK